MVLSKIGQNKNRSLTNGPVKNKAKYKQKFDRPQFNKVIRVPYIQGKDIEK